MNPQIPHLPEVQRALLDWHAGHGLHAPWRESGDPYEVLVAAVMAQQTQMSRVMPAYERFMSAFPTLPDLARATTADVIRAWAGMGYNQRALRLHRAARTVAAEGWPRDAASLERIDGIGPFTAAIIASFSFGQPAACVDTNVRRVLGRLAGDEGISPRALQRLADAALAVEHPARWNQAVMDYGARVCLPRPKCGECVLAQFCIWREMHEGSALKVADAPRPAATKRARRPAPEPYEGSRRYFRGRAIDILRALPRGDRIALATLPARLANGHAAPSPDDVRALIDGLVRDGLAAVHDTRGGPAVSLPED
ncbi:MAG TPA: A/G-specific adenine glycosylase [Dehalococcoidia bacterium]|nr:A/G-specific adenine glycosylase [Dehalococcoidia bacterium]